MADADVDAPQELTTQGAKEIVQEMIKKLETSYSDNGNQCLETDEIWAKFVVTGKGKKAKMILAEKGTCIEDIPKKAFKAEGKEISQVWCIVRGYDDDGPLRTFPVVWYYQGSNHGVQGRKLFHFNKTSLEAMDLRPSICELIDEGDIKANWPCQDVGEGVLKWQRYLKTVKTNAGAHSVKTYLFGAKETKTF